MINLPVQTMASMTPLMQQRSPLDSLMPGIAKGMQMYYAPKQMQADLQNEQLKNALLQVQNQYAPDDAKAELALKQAMAPYYQAETGNINQKTKFMPLDELINAQNTIRSSSRFGEAYQLSKMLSAMPPATRATWIANNQAAYNDMLSTIANGMGTSGNDVVSKAIMSTIGKLYPGKNVGNYQANHLPNLGNIGTNKISFPLTPNEIAKYRQQYGNQVTQNNSVTPVVTKTPTTPEAAVVPFKSTPDITDDTKLASQMEANKFLTTTATRRQAEASVGFDKFLADNQVDYSQAMKDIAPYAGLIGKGKLGWDALQSQNPQAYQSYQWFTNAFVPNVQNMITQLEGSSIAPEKQKEIKNTFESAVKSLRSDPQSAIKYMNKVIELYGQISQQRKAVAQPIFNNALTTAYGNSDIPKPYITSSSNSANDPLGVR